MAQLQPFSIISALVENKPGVLFRVTTMIRRRGFNIDSISVGPTERPQYARMTFTMHGDERTIEQVVKNLHKLVEVIKVARLEVDEAVVRELALIKVHADESKARSDLLHFSRIFRARVVDVSPDSMTIEVTGDPKKIDAFLGLVKGLGIKEVSRTGMTALARGGRSMRLEG